MVKISRLALELRHEIAEIDLNPLIATAKGCIAVDVRIKNDLTRGCA